MGLTNQIDVSKIYKYYLKNSYPIIYEILSNNLEAYFNDYEVMLPILDFFISLCLNQ